MSSKVSQLAYSNECIRWRSKKKPAERLGQRLMNAFLVDQSDPEIFHERDHNKAAKLFFERYVSQ